MTIEAKEITMSEELKRKVEMICRFTNSKPIYQNDNIRNIKGTNIAYAELYQIKIYNLIDEYDFYNVMTEWNHGISERAE